ncbi:MAG: type II toxin-antitoxin system VapC family toxin [Terriglobales bacterium]
MIAADTSTWVAFGEGAAGRDCDLLHHNLGEMTIRMPPPVLAEIYSAPALRPWLAAILAGIAELEIQPGYWQRAGELRARVLRLGRKARLGDALIAQCCLDHDVPLITRDRDFRAFAAAADLDLLLD